MHSILSHFVLHRKFAFRFITASHFVLRDLYLVLANYKASKFKTTLNRAFTLFMLGFIGGVQAFAQSRGAGGFTSATTEINSYAEPVKKLMYAIAAVIALIGAFNVYFKMQNGDQDVKKTIMMTIGGCVAMIAMATALPMFFK